jgi:hypothetical protein
MSESPTIQDVSMRDEEEPKSEVQDRDEKDSDAENNPESQTSNQLDQEDSFHRFEALLAKTENFSRCLSAGNVTLGKVFIEN